MSDRKPYRHRFPIIIHHAIWLYHRFPLTCRDVQELLLERGIEVSHDRTTVPAHIRRSNQHVAFQKWREVSGGVA